MKIIRNRVLAVLFVFLLVFSLCACSKDNSGGLGEIKTGGGNGSADLVESEPADFDPGDSELADMGEMFGSTSGCPDDLDSSGYQQNSHIYYFPEYVNSIEWYLVPRDYIGSLSSFVMPSPESTGVVNIRSGPSLKAGVIAQITRKDTDYWWTKPELYYTENDLFYGLYKVPSDGYTWTYVAYSSEDSSRTGWVATEVIEFWWI